MPIACVSDSPDASSVLGSACESSCAVKHVQFASPDQPEMLCTLATAAATELQARSSKTHTSDGHCGAALEGTAGQATAAGGTVPAGDQAETMMQLAVQLSSIVAASAGDLRSALQQLQWHLLRAPSATAAMHVGVAATDRAAQQTMQLRCPHAGLPQGLSSTEGAIPTGVLLQSARVGAACQAASDLACSTAAPADEVTGAGAASMQASTQSPAGIRSAHAEASTHVVLCSAAGSALPQAATEHLAASTASAGVHSEHAAAAVIDAWAAALGRRRRKRARKRHLRVASSQGTSTSAMHAGTMQHDEGGGRQAASSSGAQGSNGAAHAACRAGGVAAAQQPESAVQCSAGAPAPASLEDSADLGDVGDLPDTDAPRQVRQQVLGDSSDEDCSTRNCTASGDAGRAGLSSQLCASVPAHPHGTMSAPVPQQPALHCSQGSVLAPCADISGGIAWQSMQAGLKAAALSNSGTVAEPVSGDTAAGFAEVLSSWVSGCFLTPVCGAAYATAFYFCLPQLQVRAKCP